MIQISHKFLEDARVLIVSADELKSLTHYDHNSGVANKYNRSELERINELALTLARLARSVACELENPLQNGH